MHVLALLLLSAPPLAPGAHRCGTQWDSYSDICTVSVAGDTVTIASEGPSAKFAGRLVAIDDRSFDLQGELEVLDIPIGYSSLAMCDEKAPHRFRNTGKRKFFRHTRKCEDMTTTYFDIFIETVDPAKLALTKRMSALVNKHFYTRGKKCEPLTQAHVGEDPLCVRWADTGYGSPYYECTTGPGAAGRLYVFDKPKACEEIADRLNNP